MREWPLMREFGRRCGSAYPFMKFCHNARALLTAYTYQDRVSEPMSEQLSIDQGVLARIFLDFSSLHRL